MTGPGEEACFPVGGVTEEADQFIVKRQFSRARAGGHLKRYPKTGKEILERPQVRQIDCANAEALRGLVIIEESVVTSCGVKQGARGDP
jgi:hypothetical protein